MQYICDSRIEKLIFLPTVAGFSALASNRLWDKQAGAMYGRFTGTTFGEKAVIVQVYKFPVF